MNVKKIFYRLSVLLIGGALAVSCYSEDSGLTTSGSSTEVAYDPSQPIVLDTFYPDSGGMATAVILKGENFGTDISKIRVWYSQKQAAVVNSSGDRIYVITPKQPGDINTISVVVSADGTFEDADSVVFDQTFEYTTSYTVSTLAGKQSAYNTLDGSLASAEFNLPRYLTVDNEKNVFVSDCWGCYFRFVNEESDIVSTLSWLAYPCSICRCCW
ncbi:MAG: IPT/TIG domain-containing protein [Rikenellaceae bacterium]